MFQYLSMSFAQDPLATSLSCAAAGLAIAGCMTLAGTIGWLFAGTALFLGGATDMIEGGRNGKQ